MSKFQGLPLPRWWSQQVFSSPLRDSVLPSEKWGLYHLCPHHGEDRAYSRRGKILVHVAWTHRAPAAIGILTSSAFQSPLPHTSVGYVSLQPTFTFSVSSAMWAGIVKDHPCGMDQTGTLTERGCTHHTGRKLWIPGFSSLPFYL